MSVPIKKCITHGCRINPHDTLCTDSKNRLNSVEPTIAIFFALTFPGIMLNGTNDVLQRKVERNPANTNDLIKNYSHHCNKNS